MNTKIEKLDKAILIVPDGEIDLNNSPDFRKILQENIQNSSAGILVDLSQVKYMDSSGLATLVEAFQTTTKTRKKLAIFSLTDTVRNVFSITRLDEIFPICSSREEALKELDK